MPPKKDLCRNFQQGSCRYGDRCKFIHATPHQSKNSFGFNVQNGSPFQQTNQQQQMPNPFGFGVQNNNQARGGNDFGSKPNQFKPFENKWSRDAAPASQQSQHQQQASVHKCTDSESCKRIIVEDLQNERPHWKLTCYGHDKNGPCDIVGDVSCEELRALAYNDSKQGKSVQFIVERERNMLNSKLLEFQNLIQKPYAVSSFAGINAITPAVNSVFPSPASNFNRFGTSLNTGPAASPNYTFGQPSSVQKNSQASNMFQINNSPFNTSGTFGSKTPHQPFQSSFSSGSNSTQLNPISTSASTAQMENVFVNKSHSVSNRVNTASSGFGQPTISIPIKNSTQEGNNSNVDVDIWTKPEWEWNIGEIPEEAPPDVYIH